MSETAILWIAIAALLLGIINTGLQIHNKGR